MDKKLLWGILIPSIIVVVFVSLSISNIGYSVENSFSESIKLSNLFERNSNFLSGTEIIKITVKNDFFLPRGYDPQVVFACLYDVDGKRKSENLLLERIPIYDEGNLDVSSYGSMVIRVLAKPKYLSNYDSQISEYKNFDEVLVFVFGESPSSFRSIYSSGTYKFYGSCEELLEEYPDSVIRIPIIQ